MRAPWRSSSTPRCTHQSQCSGETGTGNEASFSGLLCARMRYSALRGALTTSCAHGWGATCTESEVWRSRQQRQWQASSARRRQPAAAGMWRAPGSTHACGISLSLPGRPGRRPPPHGRAWGPFCGCWEAKQSRRPVEWLSVSIAAVQVRYNCDAAERRSLKLCMGS